MTGHSLGGALAMLAALDINTNFKLPQRVRVYTFGTPRLGNVAFSTAYDARVPATFRVVVDGDFVAGMPKMFGVYRCVGVLAGGSAL
jgi:predicted lipase